MIERDKKDNKPKTEAWLAGGPSLATSSMTSHHIRPDAAPWSEDLCVQCGFVQATLPREG